MVSTAAGAAEGTPGQGCLSGAIVSTRSAKVLRRLQLPFSSVVADGHGGWYVADVRLRRVRRDGSLDPTWHSPVHRRLPYGWSSAYGTLARYGHRLYIAGRRRVVAVDAPTGRLLWRSATISGGRPANAALAAGCRTVYVGGSFTGFGGEERGGLAAIDASGGRLLPWKASVSTAVGHLALSSSRLYVAGTHRVAAVRRSTGRSTGFSLHAAVGDIGALAVAGRLVLVGGGESGGVFDARTGRLVPGYAFDQVGAAQGIALKGSTAYLGGWFGGKDYLIAIDLRTARFEKWFPKLPYSDQGVTGIWLSGDRMLAAGPFCGSP